jgi:hypothetical protein
VLTGAGAGAGAGAEVAAAAGSAAGSAAGAGAEVGPGEGGFDGAPVAHAVPGKAQTIAKPMTTARKVVALKRFMKKIKSIERTQPLDRQAVNMRHDRLTTA